MLKYVGLLIEDDINGMKRAIKCAPNEFTYSRYTNDSIDWNWVKSFEEFKKWILKFGIPEYFAFDHDLGTDAYELWHKNNGYIEKDINYDDYMTPTGYHCAKWLVDYCLDKHILFESEVHCHSQNTKGRENIVALLANFKKFQIKNGA